MFDPASVTVGQVSSFVKDFSIVGALVTFIWHARGGYELVKEFFERTTKHMDVMESGMQTLLTNHLSHIEADLKALAGRKADAANSSDPLLEK